MKKTGRKYPKRKRITAKEIAAMFNVPIQVLGGDKYPRATWSGQRIEAENEFFNKYILPVLERIQKTAQAASEY